MKHILFLLLFCWSPLPSTAQCPELKVKLEKQPIPKRTSEWKVSIKETQSGLFEMTVSLQRIQGKDVLDIHYNFTYNHYGFEVVDCEQCSEIKTTELIFVPFNFKEKKKEEMLITKVITLRKIKKATLYQIKGVGKTSILHYQSFCGCSIDYQQALPVFQEDPSPKTIVMEHPLMPFKNSEGTVNCYSLH
ncbi:MAG: hypothetical protein ACRBFS_22395 [Aureispira sp.]